MKVMMPLRLPEDELTALRQNIPSGLSQSDYMRELLHTYRVDREKMKNLLNNLIDEVYDDD